MHFAALRRPWFGRSSPSSVELRVGCVLRVVGIWRWDGDRVNGVFWVGVFPRWDGNFLVVEGIAKRGGDGGWGGRRGGFGLFAETHG